MTNEEITEMLKPENAYPNGLTKEETEAAFREIYKDYDRERLIKTIGFWKDNNSGHGSNCQAMWRTAEKLGFNFNSPTRTHQVIKALEFGAELAAKSGVNLPGNGGPGWVSPIKDSDWVRVE